MDSLKDKILMLFVSVLFFGCSNSNVQGIEEILGFSVSGKIKYETKKEQWDNFQGNGFRCVVYKIKDLDYFTQHIRVGKFKKFDFNDNNPFTERELLPFITNGKGYYITLLPFQEEKTVIIDLANQKLIYYYVLM